MSNCIALVLDHVTVGATIYLPTGDEMFIAIQNNGAYLNNQPIQVSRTSTLSDAIVHFGDFTKEDDRERSESGLRDFSRTVMQARRIRMIGTAATDLAYVACGRADALINHATFPWDIEAGKLLLVEAGGMATQRQSEKGQLFMYSNGFVHKEMEDIFDL